MTKIATRPHLLSDFADAPAELLATLRATGKPVRLTADDGAAVVVQDEAAYRQMAALAEKAEMIQFLRESKADIDAGRTVDAREFLLSLGTPDGPKL